MPTRQGATTLHVSLSAETHKQLDELSALVPNTSKSRIIEGLIRQASITGNGHHADLLTGLESRVEQTTEEIQTLRAAIAQATQQMVALSPSVNTLKRDIDAMIQHDKRVMEILCNLCDQIETLVKSITSISWWQVALGWLRYGSVSKRRP